LNNIFNEWCQMVWPGFSYKTNIPIFVIFFISVSFRISKSEPIFHFSIRFARTYVAFQIGRFRNGNSKGLRLINSYSELPRGHK
jgi:hypothetical protein